MRGMPTEEYATVKSFPAVVLGDMFPYPGKFRFQALLNYSKLNGS